MNFYEHLVAYLLLAFILIYLLGSFFKPTEVIIAYFVGLIYTLLPDIDHEKSIVRQRLTSLVSATFILSSLLLLGNPERLEFLALSLFCILIILILHTLKHRGIMHNPIFLFLLSLPTLLLGKLVFLLSIFGWGLHLVLDSYK